MNKSNIFSYLSFLLFISSIWFIFNDFYPTYQTDYNALDTEYSTDRAFKHVQKISQKQHYVGSSAHSITRNYIINQLESLGLKVHTQQDYTLNEYGEFSIPENIITKIEGKDPNAKALLLLSHYDSEPHSSYGASDASSGVAAILESVRAYLFMNEKPNQDIIICFTDAEEIGLLGAKLFVDKHPWAKKVGLVLNFESRGSGGPSNMIVETNHGSTNLIKSFSNAGIKHPLGTSLMYSVYKMLPNDTDSTVFRESADIPSFFFAFIDDHYDYHTALDVPERLNKRSLAHQGDYAYHLIQHYSKTPLGDNLKSDEDVVYFNLPILGMIYFPFQWIWYIYVAIGIAFVLILYFGIQRKLFSKSEIFKGFLVFLFSLILNFVLGYFGWRIILYFYPHYQDILQGYPYNGHDYVFAFVCFSIGITLAIYNTMEKKLNIHNAMVSPILIWLLICGAINIYLPGAAYFSLILGFALISFALSVYKKTPNLLLIWVLSLPALCLIAPLVQFFPVGLGIKLLYISTIFCVLLFGIFYVFIGNLLFKKFLFKLLLLIGVAFLIKAHIGSYYSLEQPRPNSLVYFQDDDNEVSYFASYDRVLDDWNAAFFNTKTKGNTYTIQSKYNTPFKHLSTTKYHGFKGSTIVKTIDSLEENTVKVVLKVKPNSSVRRLDFYVDKNYNYDTFLVNKQIADSISYQKERHHIFTKRFQSHLLTYHVVNQEELVLEFKGSLPLPSMEIYESSYDLLTDKTLKIPPRNPDMIPLPFVVNDAIMIKRVIRFDENE